MNNNKLRGNRLCRALALSLALGLAAAGTAPADIFVYESASGSKLITDHRRTEPGYRLVKTYRTEPDTAAAPPSVLQPIGSDYDELIMHTAQTVDLDPALIKAVMQVESAFDRYAISRKGASGLMQLMPGTANRYGVESLFDPGQNVAGGARYLRDLLELFSGNTRLALAGYNAGENAVARHGGIPPFAETRAYVRRVMGLYQQYQDRGCCKSSRNAENRARVAVADR
jgi:soluble lytic murein transglycosylase-like protein